MMLLILVNCLPSFIHSGGPYCISNLADLSPYIKCCRLSPNVSACRRGRIRPRTAPSQGRFLRGIQRSYEMSTKNPSTKPVKYTLVLVRHGESEWNKLNKFCGWHDADLSETGISEAISAGEILKEKGFEFDIAYTSVLKRAIKTLYLIQDVTDHHWIPVKRTWRLNERHYGGLQGLNKSETAEKHGEDQVKIWRRSYDIPPPPLEEGDERWTGKERKYATLDKSIIPSCECLKDTITRVMPYWNDEIVPTMKLGLRIIISAHGNSLRGLVKYLDNIPDDEIVGLNIPTGIPLVYKLDEDLRPVSSEYLADEEKVKAAMAKVAAQGKKQ